MTFNDKMDLYFNDFSMMPLFVQDNYLKANFSKSTNSTSSVERALADMELASNAAESISDGDLCDQMIHGYVLFLTRARNSTQAQNLISKVECTGRCCPSMVCYLASRLVIIVMALVNVQIFRVAEDLVDLLSPRALISSYASCSVADIGCFDVSAGSERIRHRIR
jgi:predicted aconitase with swiveling domain